jgi:hypothetical protein
MSVFVVMVETKQGRGVVGVFAREIDANTAARDAAGDGIQAWYEPFAVQQPAAKQAA